MKQNTNGDAQHLNRCAEDGIPLSEIDKQLDELSAEEQRLHAILQETQHALIRLGAAKVTLTLLALPYRQTQKETETQETQTQ